MVAFPPVFVFFQHILRQGAFARFGPFVRSVEIEPPLAPALSPNTAPPARGLLRGLLPQKLLHPQQQLGRDDRLINEVVGLQG